MNFLSSAVDHFLDAYGWLLLSLVQAAVYAGLLAVVVLAANVLLRRWLTAAQMSLLWALVLVRLCLPIVPATTFSLESFFNKVHERMQGEPVTTPTTVEAW